LVLTPIRTRSLARDALLRPSIASTPLPGELVSGSVTGRTPPLARLRRDG